MRTMHLFAGAGGGLLADCILGHEPVCAVEWDEWRCDRLRELPIGGLEVVCADASTLDFTRWAGRVDKLAAGIPCPRWSRARRGMGATSDHTDTVVRAVAEIRPEWVFVECVAGYLREHGRMRTALRTNGYTYTRPLILDAAAVGAPHPRPRYWAIGHRDQPVEPDLPIYAEMAVLPPADAGPWESHGQWICVADGVADSTRWLEALGDGQVPLQAAAAWRALGGPCP